LTRRVYIVPAVLAALAVAGVVGAGYISVPTLTHVFDPDYDGRVAEVVLTVEGVRCYGMADYLREHIEDTPGLISMVAYGGKRRVVIEYDPRKVSQEDLVAAIERPSQTEDGPVQYFEVKSREAK
jgi:hypothetical protein